MYGKISDDTYCTSDIKQENNKEKVWNSKIYR